MSYLAKGRKEDIIELAIEMGLKAGPEMKLVELKEIITSSKDYDEEFVKGIFNSIVEDRKRKEELEREDKLRKEEIEREDKIRLEEFEQKEKERHFELEKQRLELECLKAKQNEVSGVRPELSFNQNFQKLIPKFDITNDEISLFLELFERQAKIMQVPKEKWVTYLIGALPSEINNLIAREPEEEARNYSHIKSLLLQRFKLSPEKFRQLLVRTQKKPDSTWQDFYHEMQTFLEGWLSGLKIETFEQLKDLMLVDQIKRRIPNDFREYFLDEWASIISPKELVKKIEDHEDAKKIIANKTKIVEAKPKLVNKQMGSYNLSNSRFRNYKGPQSYSLKKENDGRVMPNKTDPNFEKRRNLQCYECGSYDHFRPNCPKMKRRLSENLNNISETGSFESYLKPFTFEGKVNGMACKILRDTGATIDIAPRKFVTPGAMTGEHVWVQQPLDSMPICLPVAEIVLETKQGSIATKAAIIPNNLDRGRYLLGNRSAAIFEDIKHLEKAPEQLNAVQTRRQKWLLEKKEKLSPVPEDEVPKDEADLIVNDSELLPTLNTDDPVVSLLKTNREMLSQKQRACEDLKPLFKQVERTDRDENMKENYILKNGLLMKMKLDKIGQERLLIVVPKELRENLKILCHESTSAHLGVTKTKDRLSRYFFWPNCYKELEDFVRTCDKCQKAGKAREKTKAPLKLVPIISEVFAKINVDAVGPLPLTSSGNRYLITAMCLASKYPDAIAVPDITSTTVVDALLQIFSRMGFPKEIQHDQGTSFMSVLTSEFLEKFGIKVVRSSVYHPQSNPVERFHRTIKRILRVLCQESAPDWEQHVHAALFALRTVTHESTGFTPAELVYGKNLRSPVTLLYEGWTQPQELNSSVVEYIFNLINRLQRCQEVAVKSMEDAASKRKLWYDKNSVRREFKEGDKVLVLAMSPANKLAVQWQGPGTVENRVSETNYIVNMPGRTKNQSQIYHVNLLKPYYSRTEVINLVEQEEMKDPSELEIEFPFIDSDPNILNFFEIVHKNGIKERLETTQIQALEDLLCKYSEVFSNEPGLTNLVQHDIELISDSPIRARPYRLSPRQNEILKREINKMLANKVIEVGVSDYTSPMILVEVQGKDPRPCIDYRKLNAVIKTQFYPLPNIEERIEQVSKAKFISVLDLAKGYWQIPLTTRAQSLAAFVTSFGSYRPLRLPFGLKNAPFFFSKMMAELLQGIEQYAVPYLDDVAIFSENWNDHLKHLDEVLKRIAKANLKVKPSKCAFAQEYVKYLGHIVGQEKRSPSEVKVQAIREFPTPTSKTEIRGFLGLAGYYRRYIPKFSLIAAPLTDKLKGKKNKEKVEWTADCDTAFQELKTKLSSHPVLYSPNYTRQFFLQTDASELGVGVVLSQKDDKNNEHPILYLSRKFSDAEKKFCTTEKECAAIVWAIKKLHCYLDGQKFTVQTDHNPLVWLNSNASSNPRLMRWALALQPYNFAIEHKKGSLNKNADALSRLPTFHKM